LITQSITAFKTYLWLSVIDQPSYQ